jgi:hypothetical protein
MPEPFAVVVLLATPLNVRTVPLRPCWGVIVPGMLKPVGGFWQRFRTLVKKRAILIFTKVCRVLITVLDAGQCYVVATGLRHIRNYSDAGARAPRPWQHLRGLVFCEPSIPVLVGCSVASPGCYYTPRVGKRVPTGAYRIGRERGLSSTAPRNLTQVCFPSLPQRGNSSFSYFVKECSVTDFKGRGGFAPIPIVTFQRPENHFPFQIALGSSRDELESLRVLVRVAG